MAYELTARICTDALIAPLNNLHALFLKVQCPDGTLFTCGADARGVEEAARFVWDRHRIDVMPMILADIESHHASTHPYRLRMPADLLAMIEPIAVAAE